MVNFINLHVQLIDNVMLPQREIHVANPVSHILATSREKIVQANHLVAH